MWILIPEGSLYRLEQTQLGYRVIAALGDAVRSGSTSREIRTSTAVASIKSVAEGQALVVGAWVLMADSRVAPIRLREGRLLSIWAGEGSTLWTLSGDETERAFFRVINLAYRVWTSETFPRAWGAKKVGGTASIFAADRSLADVRLAYEPRAIATTHVLEIGTLYTAHRGNGTINALPESVWRDLPDELPVPADMQEATEARHASDEGDVIINPPEGDNRHLFAMRYPAWMDSDGPLTRQQRRIIDHRLSRPLRIHGPAGSGKTLVLILKTLTFLRQAQDANVPCRILFVANSTAMRATIRAAIEAIDDRDFLATGRDDQHFLDVETLHGWCIRELGTEIGLRYALHADPTISREKQASVLEDVTTTVFTEKYAKIKALLSEDFVALWERRPEEFVRLLGWEIAIRIKGCGLKPGSKDLDQYARSPIPSFVGRRETPIDRRLIFHVFTAYEEHFGRRGLLDTDDIVLSMGLRLKASLWDRQRRSMGYDYVMVDEAHLFNENERRVLPYLTRSTTEFLPLVLTFDEAQSIGGQRGSGLEDIGIEKSDRRNLKYVHRSSPDIVALARYVRERCSLLFSQFESLESDSSMSDKELKRCKRPSVIGAVGTDGVRRAVVATCESLRATNYPRIGIVCFQRPDVVAVVKQFTDIGRAVHEVRERGDIVAASSKSGYYAMTAEVCGGLEFDAVVLVGADEGRVPPVVDDLSPEGHMAVEEDSHREVYTALTRARYRVVFVSDSDSGLSRILRPALTMGLIVGAKDVDL